MGQNFYHLHILLRINIWNMERIQQTKHQKPNNPIQYEWGTEQGILKRSTD